jgi:photosystem II stability/assembly factor-like uncharacterized protein
MHLPIKIILCAFLLLATNKNLSAQQVKVMATGTGASLRGLSVVSERVVWVSGSSGTVGRSLDSGRTWKWITVKGFEKIDFRDIEAFDETTAVIMGIGEPAYILRTADGGATWKVVYENKTKGMFLDAMEFWNEQSGIVIGDPVDHRIFIARTFDGGLNWRALPYQNYPVADSGEAMFASSGTNIRKLNNQEAIFITGGLKSRLFIRDKKIELPILQGTESTGANSVAVKNSKTWIVVGGDFGAKDAFVKNCIITTNAGKSWSAPDMPPHGYRSCVEYLNKKKWISCGLNGVDLSDDEGKTWQWISKEGFHVCKATKDGKVVYFAGGNGKVGKCVGE